MKKIFCITCHKITNPLKITTDYLSSFENNKVIIHVDKKTDIKPFKEVLNPSVIFLQERVDVTWGSYSQIESFIKLLKAAKEYNGDYIFMLSGDDLPCMKNNEIDLLIQNIDFKNLIHYQDHRNKRVDPIERLKYDYPPIFYSRNPTTLQKIQKKLLLKFKLLKINKEFKVHSNKISNYYKGVNWFGLNNKTLSEITDFIKNNDWYCEMFNNSLCGDEVFFHTLLKHLDIDDIYHDNNAINDALRYIDWVSGPDFPKTLNSDDLSQIANTKYIFARKFKEDFNHSDWSCLFDIE